jgi:hypothetical protein
MSSFKKLLATAALWAAFGTGLAHAAEPTDWCAGKASAELVQATQPYVAAVRALKGTEQGWCAVAGQYAQPSPQAAKLWEFVSGGYVFHALKGRKTLTPAQVDALNGVLARVEGIARPVTKRADIEQWLYVWLRTLSAEDFTAAQVALNHLQDNSPAVYKTLMRRSQRWGDASGE